MVERITDPQDFRVTLFESLYNAMEELITDPPLKSIGSGAKEIDEGKLVSKLELLTIHLSAFELASFGPNLAHATYTIKEFFNWQSFTYERYLKMKAWQNVLTYSYVRDHPEQMPPALPPSVGVHQGWELIIQTMIIASVSEQENGRRQADQAHVRDMIDWPRLSMKFEDLWRSWNLPYISLTDGLLEEPPLT